MRDDEDNIGQKDVSWSALKAYLLQHPDQLRRDTDLLQHLGLRAEPRRLIEFGPAALARLEERAVRDFDARRRHEQTLRANFNAQQDTHAVVLDLLQARNLSDLAHRLNQSAQDRFGLQTATLGLEDDGPVPLGWKTLAYGGVDYILGENQNLLLGPDAVCRVLFDDAVTRVKSAAVLRLAIGRTPRVGILAFGAHAFDDFSDGMATDLITFMARVIEQIAERWPILTLD